MWAPVAYIVDEKHIGLAYGIMTAALNIGGSIFPLITAAILAADDGRYIPNVSGVVVSRPRVVGSSRACAGAPRR